MNTVTVYDEYIDKNSIFGACKELHKLAITQIVLGSLGMIASLGHGQKLNHRVQMDTFRT